MPEKQEKQESETLFSKVIPKMNGKGDRQVGSMTIEKKNYDGNVFVQVSQHKEAFKSEGQEGYKPAKDSWITFDPKNKEILQALKDAVNVKVEESESAKTD